MAWGTTQGIQTPYASQNANVIPPDVFRMAIDYFPNRCPLMYNLAKLPLNALTFYMNNDTYRPRTATLNAAYTSAGTTLTLTDTTGIDVGDVLEIDSERLIVSAVGNATSLTVTGAYEGTSQANHANAATITIITNARTGAEVDQNALSRLASATAQYAQTVQHAYQVGGSLQSTGNYMGGEITPLDRDRMMAIQHTMDDMERSFYYGKGAVLSSTVTRQVAKGFSTILTTNIVTSATNASAYKPTDFIRDTLQAAFTYGGEPDMILVSTGFLQGLSQWGWTLQRFDSPVTALGIQPNMFYVSFLGGIKLIPAPLLGTATSWDAIALNSREVKIRVKRPLDDFPRGRRGDAIEGDIIMEGAIDVENESHQAMVRGITGFAVQT